jgi:hypothetical protein
VVQNEVDTMTQEGRAVPCQELRTSLLSSGNQNSTVNMLTFVVYLSLFYIHSYYKGNRHFRRSITTEIFKVRGFFRLRNIIS